MGLCLAGLKMTGFGAFFALPAATAHNTPGGRWREKMENYAVPLTALLKKGLYIAGNILAALWIAAVTAFFLVRFSTAFYRENTPAIQQLLDLLLNR